MSKHNYVMNHLVCTKMLDGTLLEKPFIYSVVAKSGSVSVLSTMADFLGINLPKGDPAISRDWKDYAFGLEEFTEKTKEGKYHFTFVRNTYDRVVSYWIYYHRHQSGIRHFDDWIISLYTSKGRHTERTTNIHIQSQLRTLILKPDFIGTLENVAEDWEQVRENTGLGKLSHRNPTEHYHYRDYYNENSRKIVSDFYAEEIEAFHFKF